MFGFSHDFRGLHVHWTNCRQLFRSVLTRGMIRRLIRVVAAGTALMGAATVASTSLSPVAGANGLTWSTEASPNQGSGTNALNGVSCPSVTFCVAVGVAASPGLIESFNGTSWSIAPLPTPGGSPYLEGVACTSVSACTAVGFYIDGSNNQVPLIESWNGSAWTITPSPSPSGAQDAVLLGVSCSAPSVCTAVGHIYNGSTDQTLVETWNGAKWSIVPSPSPVSTGAVTLNSVSCPSSSFCIAAGYYVTKSSGEATLIEGWNGTAWSIIPNPNPSTTGTVQLLGAACTSSNFCVAVGYYFTSLTVNGTLIETWDGTTWSITPSPAPGELAGVQCISPTDCVAVGVTSAPFGVSQTLIQTWNGSAWSVTPSPSPGSVSNELSDASCALATFCTAVGYYADGSSGLDERTLIEAGRSSTSHVVITTASLPEAALGVPYSFQLQAVGGLPPYTWNKYGPKGRGSLPWRVSLSRSGLISGTPKKAGTYTIIVKCLDSTHSHRTQATQTLTLTVNP